MAKREGEVGFRTRRLNKLDEQFYTLLSSASVLKELGLTDMSETLKRFADRLTEQQRVEERILRDSLGS